MKWHKLATPVELHCGDVATIGLNMGEYVFTLPAFDLPDCGASVAGIVVHSDDRRVPESLTVTRTDGTVERVEFDKEDT